MLRVIVVMASGDEDVWEEVDEARLSEYASYPGVLRISANGVLLVTYAPGMWIKYEIETMEKP